MKNLDAKINEVGFTIVKKISAKDENERKKYKNEIEKTLGVLSNDGVYAYWVYCQSKKITDVFIDEIKSLMKIVSQESDNQKFFQNLSQDLNQLLFFKEILEKALTYARYHAKAMDDK
ncbi:MAG: hypothetical protein KU38_04495 [Sulfurovum sp. FS08-3]|nr:MAG: hypothetical protein KU38_04495 [Sulfurovum sp. FS08-3]